MSTVPKTMLTPEQYLARERKAEFKSEFYGGEMFAMAGASRKHNLIVVNAVRELGNQLKGGPCEVYASDMRVKVRPTGLYTYPDVTVVCGEPQFEDRLPDTLLNPKVLFEVLSKSTEGYDRGTKAEHYRRLASLAEYVLIAQDKCHVEVFSRQPDGRWLLWETSDMNDVVRLVSIGCELKVSELYDRVQFERRPWRVESMLTQARRASEGWENVPMSSVPKTILTSEQYLARERKADFKSEFYGGEMFAMAGASRKHNLIVVNAVGELRNQLKGRPCEVYASDMRVKVRPTGLYTYPDAAVVCGEQQFEDGLPDTLLNPKVLFEVLSKSTEGYDRGTKAEHYRRLVSLAEYVLIAQDKCHVEVVSRQPDGRWLLWETSDMNDVVRLVSIGCELKVSELYDRVQVEALDES